MKRKLAMVLSLAVILGSLAGCGSKTETPAPTPAEDPKTEAPAETPAETPAEGDQTAGAASDIDWPTKSVQIICPFSPGGDSDLNARAYAKRLEVILGQPVVVTNVTGNGGAVGNNQAASSPADGYTLFAGHIASFVNQAVGATDFGIDNYEVAAIIGRNSGNVVCVSAKSDYQTLEDLMEASKAEPGKLTFAANIGASTQLMGVELNEAGAQFNLVDLGDATERVAALLGGHVTAIPQPLPTAIPYLESGDFRGLCILEEERAESYPDIPTAKELGYDVVVPIYYYLAFPKGTDEAIVNKMADALEQVNQDAEYQQEIWDLYGQKPFFAKLEEGYKILKAQNEEIMGLQDKLAIN